MNMLRLAFREIVGMFVDDGALALQSLLLIAVVTIAVEVLAAPSGWAGAALIGGCAAILASSVYRAARRR
ncbi:hypothetical protein [Mesorhizobium escarrei]|uniref:Membrane protein n=1 Tax=Mesorhizobium escarrei TaxID=666018 RepID=A0ABM9E551_9HYPH|nr:hypothetical protein [Mesorhizobium escarrei]CAH2404243.1 Membrane protein [Mesorhizobium escarrei]